MSSSHADKPGSPMPAPATGPSAHVAGDAKCSCGCGGHAVEQARSAGKVGRNDPCPCGSGRKHKKCCGR